MKAACKLGIALLGIITITTGCWDSTSVEKINYITALGIDYQKSKFIVYGQMMSFGSIAKQEGTQARTPATVWVGKGEGDTLNIAMNELYSTAQRKIIWSHVTTILTSEEAIRHGFSTFVDAIVRFREVRLTPWVFGTRMPIPDILTSEAFFNLSPLETISHSPEASYKQKSFITPIKYMTFLADLKEPAKTAILPMLTINPDQWYKLKSPHGKMEIDGALLLSEQKYKGHLSMGELDGLRWVTRQTNRSPLLVTDRNKKLGVVSLENPSVQVRVSDPSSHPRYTLRISMKGNIVEMVGNFNDEAMLKRLAEETVKKEVRTTFEKSLALGADVLQLEYALYLDHYKDWKRLTGAKQLTLEKDSLAEIDVNIDLIHSGMLR